MSVKLNYCGHIKRRRGFKGAVIVVVVPVSSGMGRQPGRWTLDIKDTMRTK